MAGAVIGSLRVALGLDSAAFDAGVNRVGSSSKRLQGQFRDLDRGAASSGGGFQNLGFQVQDFAVQVGAGTSATQALAQQLPQLLSGFGVLGAAMGTAAAVAIPLASHFLGIGKSAEDSAKQIDDLGAAVDAYARAARAAEQTPDELAEDYGIAIEQAQELLAVRRELARLTATKELRSSVESLESVTGDFDMYSGTGVIRALQDRLDLLEQIRQEQAKSDQAISDNDAQAQAAASQRIQELQQQLGMSDRLDNKIADLANTLGLTAGQASELAVKLAAVDDSADPSEQAKAWAEVKATLLAIVGDYDNLNAEGQKFLDAVVGAWEAALKMAEIDLKSGLGSAADEAERLDRAMQRSLGAYQQYQQTRAVGQTQGMSGEVSGDFIDRLIYAESGGNASAANPASSAVGLGQFIESTWLALFKEHFPDRAATMTDPAILALRTNADVSRRMVELYVEENRQILAQAGVATTEAALYLSHFLGPGGAIDVLSNLDASLTETTAAGTRSANAGVFDDLQTGHDLLAWAAARIGASTEEVAVGMAVAASAASEQAEAQREAESEAKRIADEAERRAKQELGWREDLIDAADRAAQDAQLEAQLVGKSVEEQTRLRVAYDLTNQAVANGIDLNEQIAGSTETYGQYIDRTAASAGRAAAEQDALAQAQERAEKAAEDAAAQIDQFIGALTNYALGPITDNPLGGLLSSLPGFQTGAESVFSGLLDGGFAGAASAIGDALGGISSGLAGFGSAIGAIAGPIGLGISLFKGIMGTTEKLDEGLKVLFAGLDRAVVSTYETVKKVRFFGLSTSTDTDYDAAPASVQNPIEKAFGDLGEDILALGRTLGKGRKDFADFSYSFQLSLEGMSDEEKVAAVEARFAEVSDRLARMAGVSANFIAEGETATQTLQRMVASFAVVKEAYRTLFRENLKAGESATKLATKMVGAAGGIDAFARSVEVYYAEFYDLSERAEQAQRDFNKALRQINVKASIDTLEEFRAEIERLQAAGKDKKAADLIALSEEFVAMLDLIETEAAEAAAEAQRIADERAAIQRDIWELEGNTAAIREAELAALDPANRALKEHYYALLDEAEAAEEAARVAEEAESLERQLLELQGDTEALRALELAQLDESNQARQEEIWLLEDALALQEAQNALYSDIAGSLGIKWVDRLLAWEDAVEAGVGSLQLLAWAVEDVTAVMDERESLEKQLLELQGDTAALRAMELEELSPYNRALQEQIWALEDAKAAMDALNETDYATLYDYQKAVSDAAAGMSDMVDETETETAALRKDVRGLTDMLRQFGMTNGGNLQKLARFAQEWTTVGMPVLLPAD